MKVGICSLGCKVNIYESEYVEGLLRNHGYEIVSFEDEADIYIINTCSVTNESDKKSRKMISQAKRRNREAIIVVMGCYSQVKSEEIEADIVLGNKDKSKIVEYIEECLEKRRSMVKVYNLREEIEFEDMFISSFENHTRAFVKIQDGCNAFCSYCIIPYTRGRVRSKKYEDVIKEVTNLVDNGYKEVVLTGIHTGRYGIDLEDMDLEKLLCRLVRIPGLYRIRLSSIEINEITDGIMDLIKSSKVIARHFHVPIQSGSNKILKLMNRKYDLDFFFKKIQEIRDIRPEISISTDVIVGFPGEDENLFQTTIDTCRKVGFTKLHVFPFSERKGTAAARMDNKLDNGIKKDRARRLIEVSKELEEDYMKKYLGREIEVLVEEYKDGYSYGHTGNYLYAKINKELPHNELVNVKVIDIEYPYVICE